VCVFFILTTLVKEKFRVILRVLTLLIPNMLIKLPSNPPKLRKGV